MFTQVYLFYFILSDMTQIDKDFCASAIREAQMDPGFLLWKYSYQHDAFIYYPTANEREELYMQSIYLVFSLCGRIWSVSPAREHDPANNKCCNSVHGEQHRRYQSIRWFEANSGVAIYELTHVNLTRSNMLPRFREFKRRLIDSLCPDVFILDLRRLISDYFMFTV